MAAAVVRDNVGATGLEPVTTETLRYEVWWNGVLIARCAKQADATAVAAAHPS